MDVIQEEFGVVDLDGRETYILGRPISIRHRLSRRGYSYESEESTHEPDTQEQGSTSSHHTSTCTISRSSSISKYSVDASTYDTHNPALSDGVSTPRAISPPVPIAIPRRNGSLRRHASDVSASTMHSGETHRTSSASTHRPMRSQVSMDVLPRVSVDVPNRSLRSYRSASSLATTVESSRPEARFSMPAPVPTTYVDETNIAGPSRLRRHSRQIAQQPLSEDEEEEDYEGHSTPRQVADATLRSTPGIIGIGEGWGSAAPAPKRKWWRKRQNINNTDDPLYLWSSSESSSNQEGSAGSGVSSMKALWNRSVQAFGGSMPHLPSAFSDRHKEHRKRKRESVQRSKSDLSPRPGKSIGGGRSLVDLLQRPLGGLGKKNGSKSVPALSDTLDKLNGETNGLRRTPSQIRRAGSKDRLVAVGWDKAVPSDAGYRRASGPRPPWRPASYFSNGPISTSGEVIPDVQEEETQTSKIGANRSSVTPEPITRSVGGNHELQRTDTFGAANDTTEASEPALTPRTPKAVQVDQAKRQSAVGFDTLDDWAAEPKAKMNIPFLRKPTILRRLQNALGLSVDTNPKSPIRSRPETPSPLRLSALPKFRAGTPRPEISKPVPTDLGRPVYPARSGSDLDYVIVPVRDSVPTRSKTITGSDVKHRRRSSWLGGSEGWARRLSKLQETDEEEKVRAPDSEISACSADGQTKRQSMFDRAIPSRSTPIGSKASLATRRNIPTSHSTVGAGIYSLRRLATTDLDLTLDLPERGLGLDDILNDSRRKSILAALDLPSEFAFPTPPIRHSETFHLARNDTIRSHHTRGISEPVPAFLGAGREDVTHKRNKSEPVDGIPLLAESITTSEGESSSSFPETPRLGMTQIGQGYTRQLPEVVVEKSTRSSMISIGGTTDNYSFYSAAEVLESELDRLALSQADSRVSEMSETGAVVEAVRIPSVTDMKTKVEMLNWGDVRSTPRSTRPNTPAM